MNRACEEQWACFSDLRGTDASRCFPPEQMALSGQGQEVFAKPRLSISRKCMERVRRENRIMHTYKNRFSMKLQPAVPDRVSVHYRRKRQSASYVSSMKTGRPVAQRSHELIQAKGEADAANQVKSEFSRI